MEEAVVKMVTNICKDLNIVVDWTIQGVFESPLIMLRVGAFCFGTKHLSHYLETKIKNSIQRSVYLINSLELRVQ